MNPFVEHHRNQVAGVLSCFDRVVITGTLPDVGHAQAMAGYLSYHNVRLFDYARWAEPLRNEIRDNAEREATRAGLDIEFIRNHKAFRKEQRIKDILDQRGHHCGLVHVFSAMEACASFRAWYDKSSGQTSLRPTGGSVCTTTSISSMRSSDCVMCGYRPGHRFVSKCTSMATTGWHDAWTRREWPTRWPTMPFFGFVISHERNASPKAWTPGSFIVAWTDGQDACVHRCVCFRSGYHWSIMQAEYATDVLFHRQADFQPLYDTIIRTAVHSVKADHVATFLGRKLTGAYRGEVGNDFSTRIQGTRIRHQMGASSIKLYDKFGLMARVECTTNDVSSFKLHRTVQQRNGDRVWKLAPLRKNIYSLRDLRKLMAAANERYLTFIATIDNPDAGWRAVDKIGQPAKDGGRSCRGFNLFLDNDYRLFLTMARGEWCISGFRSRDLRRHLPELTATRSSYLLKRLRTHGLTKKVGHRYKYYLTKLGKRVLATVLNIRESIVLPSLCVTNA